MTVLLNALEPSVFSSSHTVQARPLPLESNPSAEGAPGMPSSVPRGRFDSSDSLTMTALAASPTARRADARLSAGCTTPSIDAYT